MFPLLVNDVGVQHTEAKGHSRRPLPPAIMVQIVSKRIIYAPSGSFSAVSGER
jgi:hypothetical protein